ncbi:hypothetical protein OESDEN_08496 [Oesophagostomum dentatum]|uniref:Uncharacterized protein n=1 Tax=Oesophagostomum dentatum TaxID=61180 RepID=A0A0B1T798_OESDE|nr:hypothetical protein OESDEN_08496 [Oesophagostomum dentatum]
MFSVAVDFLKVWCATAVTLRGGLDKDGKYITGDPIYFSPRAAKLPKGAEGSDQLENEISRARALDARECELAEWEASSVVWIGSSNQGKSHVAILDANNPNNVIETFLACESHLLCIRGVPGISEGEPVIDDTAAKAFLCGGGKVKDLPDGIDGSDLGACEWVELRKMEDSEDGVPTYCSNDMRPSPKRTRDFSVSEAEAAKGSPEAKPEPMEKVEEEVSEEQKEQNSPETTETSGLIWLEKTDEQKAEAEKQHPPGKHVGRAALPPHIRDAMSKYDDTSDEPSTGWPTVWLGSQNQ